MFIDVESKVRVKESLDQILWDEFSYLYYLNEPDRVPNIHDFDTDHAVSIEFDNC